MRRQKAQLNGQRGSILVEGIAVVLVLLTVGYAGLQLGVAIWSVVEANSAARTGGRARSLGQDPEAAAMRALPNSLKRSSTVRLVGEEGVEVGVDIPKVVPIPLTLPRLKPTAYYRPDGGS